MKKDGLLPWLWNGVRVTMGFLFLLAASGKFRDPIKFMGGMDEYGIVHGWPLPIGAVVLSTLVHTLGLDRLVVSEWGLREGAVIGALSLQADLQLMRSVSSI